jgi:hypothetical protein
MCFHSNRSNNSNVLKLNKTSSSCWRFVVVLAGVHVRANRNRVHEGGALRKGTKLESGDSTVAAIEPVMTPLISYKVGMEQDMCVTEKESGVRKQENDA